MRLTKAQCEAGLDKSIVGFIMQDPGGDHTYRSVGGDGYWGHYYCQELNLVRVRRLSERFRRKGDFPKPGD